MARMTKTLKLHVNIALQDDVDPVSRPVETASQGSFKEGMFGSAGEGNDSDSDFQFSFDYFGISQPSWGLALNLAHCSKLTSSGMDEVVQQALDWGFQSCRFFSKNKTECFVASNEEIVVVSFRGTQQLNDWLTNLNIATKSTPHGWVHRGFYFAFQDVCSSLEAELGTLNAGNKKVYLTGHSLGGALATIASMQWLGVYPIQKVLTYGQPAVGFSSLRSSIKVSYGDNFVRFVNEDDIVTRVPPGYRHAGRLIHFKEGGSITRENVAARDNEEIETMTPDEFQDFQSTLKNESGDPSFNEGLIPSVSDHALDEYLRKLSAEGTTSGFENSVFA